MLRKSFCRICTSLCGIDVEVEGERVISVRGDVEHPLTRGYTCSKGRALPEMHHRSDRLLFPQLRKGGGAPRRASWDEVLGDLAGRLRAILDESGPDAIGLFVGGGGYMDAGSYAMSRIIPAALGTRSVYSDMSIDVISKFIVPEMMAGVGGMMARPDEGRCRLVIYAGTNPLVSHGHTAMLASPTARMRAFTASGEVWVLDPRRTETARLATRHLSTRPGSDYAVFAYLIRELLRGGADRDYLAKHAQGVDALAAAVEPFTLERTTGASGVAAGDLTDLLASVRRAGRLCVETGTGISMSLSANVTQWLAWALMVVTGSLDREGGAWINPGFIHRADEQEIPAAPEAGWQLPGPKSRPELRSVAGEFPCAALPDEIEAGNLRALLNIGGNLVTCLPGTERSVAALRRLDVLATLEIAQTPTTEISTHALPAKDQLERADLSMGVDISFPLIAAHYTPAMATPLGEVRSQWWILAQLGRRLGRDFFPGLDPDRSTDADMLALLASRAQPGLELGGEAHFCVARERAIGWLERRADALGGWRLAPRALVEQLDQMQPPAPLVMISRREPHHANSRIFDDRDRPGIVVNPKDADAAGLRDGDVAIVRSAHGEVEGEVRVDRSLPPGVLTVPHGWTGSQNVNRLTSTDEVDPLTGMPRFSGLPVELVKAAAASRPKLLARA